MFESKRKVTEKCIDERCQFIENGKCTCIDVEGACPFEEIEDFNVDDIESTDPVEVLKIIQTQICIDESVASKIRNEQTKLIDIANKLQDRINSYDDRIQCLSGYHDAFREVTKKILRYARHKPFRFGGLLYIRHPIIKDLFLTVHVEKNAVIEIYSYRIIDDESKFHYQKWVGIPIKLEGNKELDFIKPYLTLERITLEELNDRYRLRGIYNTNIKEY